MLEPAIRASAAPSLFARLDVPLPTELAVGEGTAVFVCGWCFAPHAQIRKLSFDLDGARHPVMAFGMPRLDPFAELHPGLDPYATAELTEDAASAEDPELRSYRSGFWGLVPVAPASPGHRLELGLEAVLDDGTTIREPLAAMTVVVPEVAIAVDPPGGDGPLVAVCLATHNPPVDLLERQLNSIRAQTHRRWMCLISDDGSEPARFAELERAVAGDPRFRVSRSPRRLGFYRNFERALVMVPPEAGYVALCDQDDCWHPDKLTSLIAAIGDARLIYSDCRVVARDGTVISETYWSARRNNHTDMLSLLVANSVSGAATLLRRDLLDDALPFPPAQFAHYHDHWLALVALALGDIRFVDRPLYDYVQHGHATLGHAAANRMPSLRARLRRRDRRERVRMWRLHYFVDACRLMQCVAVLRLRCGDRITRPSRRAIERFAHAEHSWRSLALLGYRGALELAGRGQTLAAEWMLFRAFGWRRLLPATARPRPQRRLRLDAVPPPDLAPRPARPDAVAPAARAVASKIEPLALTPAPAAPVRVNLLVPTIDLDHFFGGYIAKFNLAHRLTQAGMRVRVVTVDPVGPLPRSWRRTIEAFSGLDGMFDRLEVAFGREQAPLEVNPTDGFIATTWWTAHIAREAMQTLRQARAADGSASVGRFLYLIQEYEPFTFPMGTYAALAQESYTAPHFGLFSSELLRDYFRRHSIGVFAPGEGGDAMSASFENAITAVRPPTVAELSARRLRRLLFYARPEAHAARNLFELGVLALNRAVARGALPADWELNGIGSLAREAAVPLAAGASLRLLPRMSQAEYADVLRDHDVGLALMYTPHPSLVPIEMASAGMLTVTNTFENKTSETLRGISSNLLAGPAAVDSIAALLAEAVAGAGDAERRVRGSAVAWSRDWQRSFDTAALDRLVGALGWHGGRRQ
ncbi:MAG TPA: glycosyltransferase [Solirubrobacteraceae bacterium]